MVKTQPDKQAWSTLVNTPKLTDPVRPDEHEALKVTAWSWIPASPFRCPRCGTISLTRELAARCPSCSFTEGI